MDVPDIPIINNHVIYQKRIETYKFMGVPQIPPSHPFYG